MDLTFYRCMTDRPIGAEKTKAQNKITKAQSKCIYESRYIYISIYICVIPQAKTRSTAVCCSLILYSTAFQTVKLTIECRCGGTGEFRTIYDLLFYNLTGLRTSSVSVELQPFTRHNWFAERITHLVCAISLNTFSPIKYLLSIRQHRSKAPRERKMGRTGKNRKKERRKKNEKKIYENKSKGIGQISILLFVGFNIKL